MQHPERADLTVTYNGEIYNYRSLRAILENFGCKFRTDCDTELLLHAYVKWGESLVDYIEGMFAFALCDGAERKIFFARDPVGQKPLFYSHTSRGLVFASTSDAIRILDHSINKLSPTSLCYVLTIGYVPSPHSIWQGVQVLPPGHTARWTFENKFQVNAYWQPPDRLNTGASEDESFFRLFPEICAEHTISDVPIGLFLSAGLDSTSVARALTDAGTPIKAYTFEALGDTRSEADVATKTARFLGLDSSILQYCPQNFDDLFDAVARTATEPQNFNALLPMYSIAQRASQDVKTVLSGDGGDELFGGYHWYQPARFNFKKWTRSRLRDGLSLFRRGFVASPSSFDAFSKLSILHAHVMRIFQGFLPNEAAQLFSLSSSNFSEETMLAPFEQHFLLSLPSQIALQRVDLMTFCSGLVLTKVDRMSMAHSLEVRSPFLDRRIINWALSTEFPPAKRGEQKKILRKFLKGRVPEAVMTQPKRGFGMRGLKHRDIERLKVQIGTSQLISDGILNDEFDRFIAQGTPNRSQRIWMLAGLSKWYDHHKLPPSQSN